MKKELNIGKAALLLDKLIEDTRDNKLRWEKEALVYSAEENKKLVGRKKGEEFTANVNDTLSAHIMEVDDKIKIWMERHGERIYVERELFDAPSIMEKVRHLVNLVKVLSDVQVMREIDEYIGVPFDEKAYLIEE